MAEHEQEVFLPEEVDEQIEEHLASATTQKQPSATSAEQAVQALQHYFAPAEEDAALQRVWQRFEQQQAALRKRKVEHPHTMTQPQRRYPMKQAFTYKEGSSLARRLNLAVAVIFVLLLVGSAVLMFRLAPNRQSIVSSAPKEKMMFAIANGTLYRLDMKTHKPLWHITGTIQFGELVDTTYYVVTMNGNSTRLYALDVTSGKIRWQVDGPNNVIVPMISNNHVYFSSLTKDGYLTVVALDSASGAKEWEHRLGDKKARGEKISSPMSTNFHLTAASDQAVYGEFSTINSDKSKLNVSKQRIALNAQNGNQLWQKNEEIPNIIDDGTGFVVDGILYVEKSSSDSSKQQGYFLAYDAASGKQLWSKQLDGPISRFGTTLLNGVIYLNTSRLGQQRGNSIYAFSAKDGSQLWYYQDASTSGTSYPTVTENGIYINRYAGQTLVALDTATGKVRWTYKFKDDVTIEYPPSADNDNVYLSLPNNVIQILWASNGKPIGSFKVGGKVDPNNRVMLQVV